jgi:hypothetical protein
VNNNITEEYARIQQIHKIRKKAGPFFNAKEHKRCKGAKKG